MALKKKYGCFIVMLISAALLSGCASKASTAYASDKTMSIEDFFGLYHITEDGTLLWVDEYNENILYDSDGKEYFEVKGKDYEVEVMITNEGFNPKKIKYEGGQVTGNVTSKWIQLLEDDGISYKELAKIEDEKYISINDVLSCYKVVELNTDNFWDYFSYVVNEKEEEITGNEDDSMKIYKPKRQKVLEYIGKGNLVSDFSSTITFEGEYDYNMSLYIYDEEGNVTSSSDTYFANTENYSRTFDVNDFSNIYFPNTLEYWTYRSLDGSTSKYTTDGTITLTNVEGKILLFDSKPNADDWNTSKNGERYLAIKLDDDSVVRCFEKFGYINPSDFSLQERSFYEGFSFTISLDGQIQSTLDKIVNNVKDLSAYEGLSNDEIAEKYCRDYKFTFGNMRVLGNYSIDDF